MTATDLPHVAHLLAALDGPTCQHCYRPLPRANIRDDGETATCCQCYRDSPVTPDCEMLLVLADAFEEAGDPRVTGLRLIGDRRPWRLNSMAWAWTWFGHNDAIVPFPERAAATLAAATVAKLRGGTYLESTVSPTHVYPSRSAAFLALAEALATP